MIIDGWYGPKKEVRICMIEKAGVKYRPDRVFVLEINEEPWVIADNIEEVKIIGGMIMKATLGSFAITIKEFDLNRLVVSAIEGTKQ
jgi:hypothetical protein